MALGWALPLLPNMSPLPLVGEVGLSGPGEGFRLHSIATPPTQGAAENSAVIDR